MSGPSFCRGRRSTRSHGQAERAILAAPGPAAFLIPDPPGSWLYKLSALCRVSTSEVCMCIPHASLIPRMYRHQLVLTSVGHHHNPLGNYHGHVWGPIIPAVLQCLRKDQPTLSPFPVNHSSQRLRLALSASLAPLSIRLHVVPGGPSARANGATTCVYPLPDSRFRLHATSSPRPWHRRHHSVTHPVPLMGPSPNRPSHQKGWGETCPSCALKPYGQCQPAALAPPART